MRITIITIVVTLFFCWVCTAKCYDYWNGDVVPTYDNSTYCKSIIVWPVSDQVLKDSASRDSQALAYYVNLYNSSYQQGAVTTDCLGIIKYMACAAAYPTCDGSTSSIPSVCSWLCELMSIRCGTTTQLYQDICVTGSTSANNCSSQGHLVLLSLLLATFLFLF